MYDRNTVYIVGNARTTSDNAITQNFNSFFIGFVVDRTTGEIVDVSCSATISTTEKFIASLFLGKTLEYFDQEIKDRYFGSSQKAIIVAYKDGIKKYNEAICKKS